MMDKTQGSGPIYAVMLPQKRSLGERTRRIVFITEDGMHNEGNDDILKMVTEIVSAYVAKNPVAPGDLPIIIKNVHATLGGISGAEPAATPPTPAVPIKKSVTADHIICLEDGKKLKMLKRYLRARYRLTPDEYRKRWNLPADYPMVAPNYAKRRSDFAKKIGLGRSAAPKRRRKS
jgi:predicted transcriptional regulator